MPEPEKGSSDPLDSMAGKTLRIFLLYCGLVLGVIVVSKVLIEVVFAFAVSGARFPEHAAAVAVNPNFPAWTGTPEEQESAVLEAAREWTARSGADFRFLEAGRTDTARVDTADGVNAVFYLPYDSRMGALASTFMLVDGGVGEILGFDVVFWDRDGADVFRWSAGRSPARDEFDVQETATHELGHALGLEHSTVSGATMSATGAPGSTSGRSLHSDDQAGARFLYGARGDDSPVVTAVVPSEAEIRGGATVRISGSGLEGGSVLVGDRPAETLESGDDRLVVVAPPGAALGPSRVVVRGASGAEVVLAGALAYVANEPALDVEGVPRPGETILFRIAGPPSGVLALLADRRPGESSFFGVGIGLAGTPVFRAVADSIFDSTVRRPPLSASGEAQIPLRIPEKPGFVDRTVYFQAVVADAPRPAGAGARATRLLGVRLLP